MVKSSNKLMHCLSPASCLAYSFTVKTEAIRSPETPVKYLIIARLLCDGTNLREGGEVKGKQDNGVGNPVTSHFKADTCCEVNYPIYLLPLTKIVFCACVVTL
jgi:hypothetical protein